MMALDLIYDEGMDLKKATILAISAALVFPAPALARHEIHSESHSMLSKNAHHRQHHHKSKRRRGRKKKCVIKIKGHGHHKRRVKKCHLVKRHKHVFPAAVAAIPRGPNPIPSEPIHAAPIGSPSFVCTPNPNFQVGIQDDAVFVWQEGMSREEGFAEASRLFGSNVLRINLIYGEIQQTGWTPFIEAAQSAVAHGYQVYVTIVDTPTYLENVYSDATSARNPNPEVFASFASEAAQVMAPYAAYIALGNEPNDLLFLYDTSISTYEQMYLDAYDRVHTAAPHAQIIAGELAPAAGQLEWIDALDSLPANGISIHPYGETTSTPSFVANATEPTYLSEYGNTPGPNQLAEDKKGIEQAQCGGARMIVLYELKRGSNPVWDTGILE